MKINTVYEVEDSKRNVGRYKKIKNADNGDDYPFEGKAERLIACKLTGDQVLLDESGNIIYEDLPTEVNQVKKKREFEIWICKKNVFRSDYAVQHKIVAIRKIGGEIFETSNSVYRHDSKNIGFTIVSCSDKKTMKEGEIYIKNNLLFFLARGNYTTNHIFGVDKDTYIILCIYRINDEKVEEIMRKEVFILKDYGRWEEQKYDPQKEKQHVEFKECEEDEDVVNITCYNEKGVSEYYFSSETGERLQKKIVYEPLE